MKRLKKALAVFLCVVLTLTAAPLGGFVGLDLPSLFDFKAEAATYSGTCGENLIWSLDIETGLLEISGTGIMTNYSIPLIVPWDSYLSYIKSVEIGDGVTTIGDYAFISCVNLTSITIPDGVKTLGEGVFLGCESLSSVTIPDSITTIGKYAFESCTNLTSITIPDSVITIDECAFNTCYSLTNITIGKGVTTIGFAVFNECYRLTDVYYGSTEEDWNKITIGSNNDSLTSATIHFTEPEPTIASGTCGDNLTWTLYENGLLEIAGTGAMSSWSYSSNAPWYSYRDSIKTVNIRNGVTSIGSYAFPDCDNLTSITIPDGVAIIGAAAFYGCDRLAFITIPDSVTNILGAFCDCTGLISITIPDGITSIGEGTFSGCENLISIVIPDSVTSIGRLAFNNCGSLTNITIPDNVTSIGDWAFQFCDDLSSITLLDGITSIGEGTFTGCSSLTSIVIPDSVTSIGGYAFQVCNALTSITISDSVTSIGSSAFLSCKCLTDVYYGSTEEDWNKISIGSDNESLTSATIHYNYGKPLITPANGAVVDNKNGIIYGLDAGINSLDSYTGFVVDGYEWTYNEGQYGFGTGTVATLKNGNEIIAEYTVVIFGDIDGNGWYDANDAFIVNMIASGLIDESRLSEAERTAADCNHDGVINELDFDLLINASVLLDDVDQSATQAELVTNSVYIAYCSLIDQTAGEETNLVPVPDLDEVPSESEQNGNTENKSADEINFEVIFTTIFGFIKKIFSLVLSFIVK